jgi:hypothetical protein
MIRNEYTITRTQKQQTPPRFCAEFFSDSTHERRKKLQREMAVALLLPSSLARCHLSLRRGRPSQYSATPKAPYGRGLAQRNCDWGSMQQPYTHKFTFCRSHSSTAESFSFVSLKIASEERQRFDSFLL